MHISLNIKHLRQQKKMRQEDLGRLLGLSHAQIGQYERGHSDVTVTTAAKLCEIFGVSIQDLIFTNMTKEGYETQVNEPQSDYKSPTNREILIRLKMMEDYIIQNLPEIAAKWGLTDDQ